MKTHEIVHSVSRGSFWLALEKGAAVFSGMAYFALLLRWLGPTKYGIMTLALSFTGLATTATGNFEEYLARYAAEYEARGLVLTLRRAHLLALGVKLALGLLASAVLIALAPTLARQFDMPELTYLIPLLSLTVACDGFSTTGRATLYGIQQFRWVSGLSVAFNVAKTVMVGVLWWTRHGLVELAIGFSALIVVQGVVQTLVPLWLMRHAEDREPPDPERAPRALLRGMFRYCVPLLGARITFLSGLNLSKIILGKLFDASALGLFSFAYNTVERFVELASTVPASLLPPLTRLVARGEDARLRSVFDQALRLIQTMAFVLSLSLFVFAREITLLVGSPLFERAIPMLRILALVPLARTAQAPLTMLFQSLRRSGTVLGLALVKFGTELGCYFLFVLPFGIVGAAWANLTGALVAYLAAMALLARVLPEGAAARARSGLTVVALMAPVLALTLLADAHVHGRAQVALHVALLLPAALGVFALGLVRREDIDKLRGMPLEAAWSRRARDTVVAGLGLCARVAPPRRAT